MKKVVNDLLIAITDSRNFLNSRHLSDGEIFVAFFRVSELTRVGFSTCTSECISLLNKTQQSG